MYLEYILNLLRRGAINTKQWANSKEGKGGGVKGGRHWRCGVIRRKRGVIRSKFVRFCILQLPSTWDWTCVILRGKCKTSRTSYFSVIVGFLVFFSRTAGTALGVNMCAIFTQNKLRNNVNAASLQVFESYWWRAYGPAVLQLTTTSEYVSRRFFTPEFRHEENKLYYRRQETQRITIAFLYKT